MAKNDFYVDPHSASAMWLQSHADDPRAAQIAAAIANQPMARWFGNWNHDVHDNVQNFVMGAAAMHKTPILVSYNIPNRDCGGESAGGADDSKAYRRWVAVFAQGIGKNPAIVVVEPDSLGQLDCLKSAAQRNSRLALLKNAVAQLQQSAPAADVYLDAGNAHWIAADEIARRLNAAGIAQAKGFSLNVSNFYNTERSIIYANAVNSELEKQFGYTKSVIIDTSRNGNGSQGQWCNPARSKLGSHTGYQSKNILLAWIKAPGNSDGACGIAPTVKAGVFSPELAQRLIEGK
ncbi:glycoside hydrolase family 6 protein [Rouxiella sp. Mn2063]|uniref:glycoside hydrolase family 6 protein n=1 Tax=Rouxiella sp. Mn2063 TaxID=3395262 RepID=UPI003BE14143